MGEAASGGSQVGQSGGGISSANDEMHGVSVAGAGDGRVTHRSSSFASRSATLSSMRKMSCSSREKERAIVLERQRSEQSVPNHLGTLGKTA